MKKLICLIGLSFVSQPVLAKKVCTDQPKSKWMTEKQFRDKVSQSGYRVTKFKQPGSCYEIYGYDKDGRKVEVYFDPTNAKVIKTEFED